MAESPRSRDQELSATYLSIKMNPADNEGDFVDRNCRRTDPRAQSITICCEQDRCPIGRLNIPMFPAIWLADAAFRGHNLRSELIVDALQPDAEAQDHIACHVRIAADQIQELLRGQSLSHTIGGRTGCGAVVAIFDHGHLTEPLASSRMAKNDRDASFSRNTSTSPPTMRRTRSPALPWWKRTSPFLNSNCIRLTLARPARHELIKMVGLFVVMLFAWGIFVGN